MARKPKVKQEDRKRLEPAERRAQILAEAFKQAQAGGLGKITRVSVAGALGLTDGIINRYFEGVTGLQSAVLSHAVVERELNVIADAVEMRMALDGVPPDLVRQATALLAK